jgi:hypothetical protein
VTPQQVTEDGAVTQLYCHWDLHARVHEWHATCIDDSYQLLVVEGEGAGENLQSFAAGQRHSAGCCKGEG